MNMNYYNKNMQLLKEKYNRVYKKIKNAEKNELFRIDKKTDEPDIISKIEDIQNKFTIYVEKARKSAYTMRIKKKNNAIYFHSKYAPDREAEKIVRDFGFSAKKQIIILGTGLGYYLKQFNDSVKYDKIVVIEPFLSIFYAAVCYNDLTDFLDNGNIVLLIDDDEKIFDTVRVNAKISLEKNIDFLEHSPSLKLFAQDYKKIYKSIREAINYQKVGLVTDIQQTKGWRNNIICNLPHIFNGPKADDFFNQFKDIPAICAAAGPSLDKNIEELKKVEGKALIMCVGTSLKALLKHGIEPDIVVTMDGKYANYRHFKDISSPPDSFLFSELGNNNLINEKWNDKQVFFTMKRNFGGWVEELKGQYTVINTGGTVAHSMVDLAYKFGCAPIIMVGQDLAYSEGIKGKTHASGTAYGDNKSSYKNFIQVEDVNGDKVFTNKKFLSMISYFNNYFAKRKDRTFIDATEGGARIDHTKIMKLSEVISKYCLSRDTNAIDILERKYKESKPNFNNIKDILKKRIRETINELKDAVEITKKQIETMNNVKNELRNNKNLSDMKIDKLERSFSVYEKDLKSKKHIAHFVDRILIIERMKLKEVKSKYYISKKHSLEQRLKYYYKFRVKFLKELEDSLQLLNRLYLNSDGTVNIYNELSEEERKGLV